MKISETKIRKIVRALINEINDPYYELDNLEPSGLIDDENFDHDNYVEDLISVLKIHATKVGPSADWADIAYKHGKFVVTIDPSMQKVELIEHVENYDIEREDNEIANIEEFSFGTPVDEILNLIS